MSANTEPNYDAAIEALHSAAESPDDQARAWKQQTGRPVIGTFCSYVPEEVVIAAGALPLRILQVPGEFSESDASLQAYACCLARGALQLGMIKGLDVLDGVIFSNTCDTMQCLADIWLENVGGIVETFMMPIHVGNPAARDYTVAEVRRLADALGERLGVTVSTGALSQAVAACQEARSAMAALHDRQRGPSPLLTSRQYYDAMMARWVMPPQEYAVLLRSVLDRAQALDRPGPRIVVAGGPMYGAALPNLLDELGACWVADDLCTGTRGSQMDPAMTDDPVAAIAERLLGRPKCPAKHRGEDDPGRGVVAVARAADADGVIVYRLKFCDPHAFDYPRIKRSLDDAGLPNLLLEVETPDGSIGQLRTRLQAFLEMLSAPEAVEAQS